jgi:hypothetical protein
MSQGRSSRLRWRTCRGLVVCLALACGAPAPEAAQESAIRFFAARVEGTDPSWAAIFPYLERRYGLVVRDARGAPLRAPAASGARGELAAVYRRLFDPAATIRPERIAALPSAIDRLTALALHCDRIALPPDFRDALGRATELGGYALTHAALAGQWTLENRCAGFAELRPLQAEQVERLAALAGDRAGLGASHEAGYDLWIEALAMLHYLGAGGRVRGDWLAELLASQREDGGWSRSPREDRSDPHATALALWVLLETLHPEAPPAPFIPGAPAPEPGPRS